jgi:hypothetical protein
MVGTSREEMHMHVRTAVVVAALLIGVWAAPAGAGFEPGTLSVTPSSGPLGTDFTVSGDQCDGGVGEWRVYPVDSDELLAAGGDLADEAGVWQDGFPTGSSFITAPGSYVVEADCGVDEEVLFSYEPVTFTVTAPPDTTPPDTAPPADSSTSTTAAVAAAAATARPTFTG